MSLQVFSSFCQLSSILVFVSSSPYKMKDHQSRSILLNLGPFNHLEAYDLRDLGHVVFFYQLQYAKLRKIREEKSSKGNHQDFCLHLEHRPHQIFVYTIVVIQTHFCSIKRVASKTKGHNFLGTQICLNEYSSHEFDNYAISLLRVSDRLQPSGRNIDLLYSIGVMGSIRSLWNIVHDLHCAGSWGSNNDLHSQGEKYTVYLNSSNSCQFPQISFSSGGLDPQTIAAFLQ